MPNRDQLELLLQGVEVWNLWREQNPEIEIDLSGASLHRTELYKVNLKGANLKGAHFYRTILREADLTDADLQNSVFDGTFLYEANLEKADLSGSILRGDLIHRADLRKANLERAKLLKANLERADLRKSNLKMADFRQANLYMADLRGAILEGANFNEANLYGARLYGTRRTGMKINNAIIRETLLEDNIQVESEYHLNEEYEDTYDFSLLHPKKLAKGHSSLLTVRIYLPLRRAEIAEKIKRERGQVDFELLEKLYESQIRVGTHVIIRPFCPGIDFQPEEIRKFLHKPINLTNINMKPVDECLHGRHEAILTIADVKTGEEFESISFTLMVDDYAFDHVSRPLVSYISAAAGTLSSIAVFTLTFLQQIDLALGMTAGSAAMIFAAFYGIRPSITYTRAVTNSSSQQP
jgi:uncharacterized protein YjbI with pentapeptide repeats